MSDPVAEKSSFLCMYMSGHPDTLVAYAKHFGGIKGSLKGAKMTGISTKSMELQCTMKDGSVRDVSVPIKPPLAGYDDVKPRLLEMKAVAQESLGMIKTPQLTSFKLPLQTFTVSLPIVLPIVYFALPIFFGKQIPSQYNFLFNPANDYVRPYTGDTMLKGSAYVLGVLHMLEALYTFTLCRKHATFLVGLQYVFATLLFGMPIWRDLRKRIQAARIDSVMKVE